MENLKDVAHIAGRPGLFKIIKPGRAGVIVESLDDAKKKEIVNVNAKVSVLKDISIYSTEFDKSTPLAEIFMTMKAKHGDQVDMEPKKASNEELFEFFGGIMPDFDPERVYSSDVKKIIMWYNALSLRMPELFEEEKVVEEKPKKEAKTPKAETKKETPAPKAAAKKATTAKAKKK